MIQYTPMAGTRLYSGLQQDFHVGVLSSACLLLAQIGTSLAKKLQINMSPLSIPSHVGAVSAYNRALCPSITVVVPTLPYHLQLCTSMAILEGHLV